MKITFPSWLRKPTPKTELIREETAVTPEPSVAVQAAKPSRRPAITLINPANVAAPPAPPEVRAMEEMLSCLASRVGETLAKTTLYFPAADLELLGVPTDSKELAAEADGMARGLLMRAEIKNGEKYVTYGAELDSAIRAAQYAAHLFHLLSLDSRHSAAFPLLRRAADAADRVIVRAAKLLVAPVSEAYERGCILLDASSEMEIACHKAAAMLRRQPALLPEPAERMARAAVWSIAIAAEQSMHAALAARGLILSASEKSQPVALNGLHALPTPPRRSPAQSRPLAAA